MRYTVSPMLGRAIWPLLRRKLFGPASMPAKFADFPVEMAPRPSTIRASAAESALMIPNAFAARGHYAELNIPVSIIAGDDDPIVDIEHQSARLHRAVPHCTFDRVIGVGHMSIRARPNASWPPSADWPSNVANGPTDNVVPFAAK